MTTYKESPSKRVELEETELRQSLECYLAVHSYDSTFEAWVASLNPDCKTELDPNIEPNPASYRCFYSIEGDRSICLRVWNSLDGLPEKSEVSPIPNPTSDPKIESISSNTGTR